MQYRQEENDLGTQSQKVRNALNSPYGRGLDWTWQEAKRGNKL